LTESKHPGSNPKIPFYIMTSPQTHSQIVTYFEEKKFFGLDAENVFFFSQGTLPCFTNEGKIMMEGDNAEKVAQAPDGNGGIYKALHTARSGSKNLTAIEDMKNRGVEGVMVFAVDNAICKVGDPAFVGYCLQEKAELGVKVVPKANAGEKVGHLVKVDGKAAVIEYTEIGKLAEETNEDGSLKFNAGSICIHYYSVDFLVKKCGVDALPTSYHVAKKKIPTAVVTATKEGVAASVEQIKPTENNGVKLEIFIFDVFPAADITKVTVLEATRSEEFTPVKNANAADVSKSVDSPYTARTIITTLHKKWLEDAGVTVTGGDVEISPLVSYGGEGLECLKGKTVNAPAEGLYIDSEWFRAR